MQKKVCTQLGPASFRALARRHFGRRRRRRTMAASATSAAPAASPSLWSRAGGAVSASAAARQRRRPRGTRTAAGKVGGSGVGAAAVHGWPTSGRAAGDSTASEPPHGRARGVGGRRRAARCYVRANLRYFAGGRQTPRSVGEVGAMAWGGRTPVCSWGLPCGSCIGGGGCGGEGAGSPRPDVVWIRPRRASDVGPQAPFDVAEL